MIESEGKFKEKIERELCSGFFGVAEGLACFVAWLLAVSFCFVCEDALSACFVLFYF